MIVVDASVIAKCYLPEKDTEQAESLMYSGVLLVAPDILRHEVVSAAVRQYRMGKISLDNARGAIDEWLLQAETVTFDFVAAYDLLPDAAALALRLKHPLHDCFYLALALREKAQLVTADRRLYECGLEVEAKVSMLAAA